MEGYDECHKSEKLLLLSQLAITYSRPSRLSKLTKHSHKNKNSL